MFDIVHKYTEKVWFRFSLACILTIFMPWPCRHGRLRPHFRPCHQRGGRACIQENEAERIQANEANRHSIHWKLSLEEAFVDGFSFVFLQAEACSKKHQSRSILYISRTFKTGLTFLIIFIIHSDGICLILHSKAKLGYIKRKISIH